MRLRGRFRIRSSSAAQLREWKRAVLAGSLLGDCGRWSSSQGSTDYDESTPQPSGEDGQGVILAFPCVMRSAPSPSGVDLRLHVVRLQVGAPLAPGQPLRDEHLKPLSGESMDSRAGGVSCRVVVLGEHHT
jgi:hypothetical protein